MAETPVRETDDMNELRRDAIRRAREMQARAQIPPAAYAPPPEPESPPEPSPEPPENGPDSGPPAGFPPEGGPAIGGALDFLLKDSERTLILALMLILMEEKADTSLIFAMMYLLL